MKLEPGSKLGRYEIVSFIGAGGMGQVYRARDAQLGRDVAIKLLPTAYTDKPQVVARFQQEGRALGLLNHPNLVTVYDFGTHEDSFYIVLELLEGETLRARLRRGNLPQRKAVIYAMQIALGMAAAHERGIVHRDLKPENIFLTNDGRLKILDFGLAKMRPELAALGSSEDSPTIVGGANTVTGVVMGTMGYISPEQLRAEAIDERADIFAFGVILYEMLAGRPPFAAATPADTMTAILKDDPPDFRDIGITVAPGVELVVTRCLEKRKEARFQSAHDLGFALEALSGATSEVLSLPLPVRLWKTRGRRYAVIGGIALSIVAIFAMGAYLGHTFDPKDHPHFRQLTFRRGDVAGARFGPGGEVIYCAAWDGSPYEMYTTRPDGIESRPLSLKSRELLAVSRKGDLALLVKANESSGTLAVSSLSGGAPRDIASNVQAADWSGDGKLAVARALDGRYQIEYPVGKIVFQSATRLRDVRVSPDGKWLAFRQRGARLGKEFALTLIDAAGVKPRRLGQWTNAKGLAWSPDGKRIIFASSGPHGSTEVFSCDLSGHARLMARYDGSLRLHDVSQTGDLLLTRDDYREGIMARAMGSDRERDLSWFDGTGTSDISPDGRVLLMSEFGEAGGPNYSVYLRTMAGEPAVRLGEGYGVSLSPDGQSALAIVPTRPARLAIVPTGAGTPRFLERGEVDDYEFASWLPDGQTVVFTGRSASGRMRLYRQDIKRGAPVTLGQPGFRLSQASRPSSPDGRMLAVRGDDTALYLMSVDGNEPPQKLPLELGFRPVSWTADGRGLFVYREDELPAKIYRFDLASGQRQFVRELMPSDPAGVYRILDLVVTPDAGAYAYGVMRNLSTLYVSQGWRARF